MCDMCRDYPDHHPQCPNYVDHQIGVCENCGIDLYAEYPIWVDNNGYEYCSEECAKDFNGIKEKNY